MTPAPPYAYHAAPVPAIGERTGRRDRKKGHTMKAGTEERAIYAVELSEEATTKAEDAILRSALAILERRMMIEGNALTSPSAVKDYLRLALATREHEVFVCIWMDAQHRVIAHEELFRGTLTQTSVYPLLSFAERGLL